MIRWLLSRSAEYRALREDRDRLREALQSVTTEKLMLQDRLDSTLADRDKLWDMAQQCISQERVSYQMQINAQWQKQGFGAPYPDAPKLPPNALPSNDHGPIGSRPEMPSAGVARANAEFIRSIVSQ